MNDFVKNFPSPNNLSSKESHSNSYDNPPNKFRKIVKENDVSQASPIFIKTTEPITTLDNNSNDLLHGSKRSVVLKEGLALELELELDKIISQYTNSIKEWLKGCLGYEFVGERIGRQISGNDQMLEDPVIPVILSVEAVMFLIENNIPLGCLDNTTLNNLSKDELVEDLVGEICNNLAISSEERYDVATECYKLYDNIEFV